MSQTGPLVRSQRRSASSLSASSARFDAFALGLSGADNRQPVVIEIGSKLTKVGYAGEFLPRAIIRTELIDGSPVPCQLFESTVSIDEQYHILVKFLKQLFFRNLLTVAKDRRIVIVESVLEPTRRREMLARALFEALDAPSVLFAPSHLLATFPFATSNALVIDIGFKEAVVIPILEGVTVLNNWEASSLGAERLERRACELLHKYGKVMQIDGSERQLTEEDDVLLVKNRILEDIVVRFCFATKMERGLRIQAANYSIESDIPSPPCDVRLPFGNEMLVVPGAIREWTAEVLFEYDDDGRSIPQLILDSVFRSPIDSRRILLNSLILVGGPTLLKGFYARLRDELLRLVKWDPYASKLRNVDSVKFFRLPNTSIELYANWLGGSMFGSLDVLQYRSLSREDWLNEKIVPDWTTKISGSDAAIRDSFRDR
uniref:Actin-related protein 10 n=1 Tax=Parascaris univalens TaxID=6257 RepID=A0A914ZJ35_PARUN